MYFGTMCTKQDHAVTGVLYDMRRVYEGLSQLSDMRKAREKLSRLETVLMIIVMAKLRGNGKKLFRRSYLQGFFITTPPLFSTLRKPCIETWSSDLRSDTP